MSHGRTFASLAALGLLCGTASAQIVIGGSQAVVFTIEGTGRTASGSSGTALADVDHGDVLHYAPPGTASAEKVVTPATVNCLLGDEDFDNDHFEDILGGFDALDVQRYPAPNPVDPSAPLTIYDYVFSAANSFGGSGPSTDNGPRGAADGSIFRFVPGFLAGDRVELVLSEQSMLDAIGQSSAAGDDVDIDAWAQDDLGNVYFSFDEDELVNGNLVGDGAVLYIDIADLTYASDGRILVVNPGSAVVILDEADVDAMVVNAGISGVSTIGDLTALTVDLNGLTFIGVDGIPHPNLMFSGEDLGPAILSTDAFGSFASCNGVSLGGATPDPLNLGLSSLSGHVSSLVDVGDNGRIPVVDQFDDEVSYLGGESHVEWDIGNCTPNSSILFVVGISPCSPGSQPVAYPIYGQNYPEFFPIPLISNLVFTLPTDSNGIAKLVGVLTHSISTNVLTSQAYDYGYPQLGEPGAMFFP